MTRSFFVAVSIAIYFIFFATFLYLIGFVGGVPFLPHTVDQGPMIDPVPALAIDVALIAGFGIQHSVMARQGFKRAWTRIVPEPLERSIYVLAASLMLILLFAFWHPIAGTMWAVTTPAGQYMLYGLFGLSWGIVLLSTFLINHFELFGLSQAMRHWMRRDAAPPKFRVPFLYRMVRHPLYSGFFLAFWATPVMSAGHLLLALGMSAYMLIAIRYEERDLVSTFGSEYEDYRTKVGMLTPKLGRAR